MVGKNIKYYRLKNNMTIKALAEKVGVTSMAISNYENNKRTPDYNTLKKIADVLDINVVNFMSQRTNLDFYHKEFRKNSDFKKTKQELLKEMIEEYFSRFFFVVNVLGSSILSPAPIIPSIKLDSDNELNALKLREYLQISNEGPINNIIDILEKKGFLIYLIDFDDENFSGCNGLVNDYPYIAINKRMTPERQRFTIVHELVHLVFDFNANDEKLVNSISGAFLFPKKDAYRELGHKRSGIKLDMIVTAIKYGISMLCLAYRARELNIISENSYRNFMVWASSEGWRKEEPSRIVAEKSLLFKQLVYRAIDEDEISIQKGAEILNISYDKLNHELNQLYVRGINGFNNGH
ncbi:MAG TPA: ImmA/IrrE family metallo-endopeptidase [Acholeplasmataceae bacterium]|nr:ImmA/IrrE family metallo-endopeptidase [Acholeplasmataceae bacterium]